jgi:GGDEF domain-containing protein
MMDTTTDRDHLLELSTTVSCYLSLLSAVGECVGAASPEVGGPYRKRIDQLRTRVFFQSTPKAITSSLKVAEGELSDYAAVAAQYLDQHDLDLRRTIVTLEHALDKLDDCRTFHGTRMLDLAAHMEAAEPAGTGSANVAAGELRRSVESMNRETDAALDSVRREMAAAEERLRGSGSTDPSTGLLNAREFTRQMEARRASGVAFSLLRFELHGSVTEPVMKQAAGRIEKQFRQRDRIARWSETEFMVLFQGPPEVAEARASQVSRLLAGCYELTTGGQVEIAVHVELADREVALA